MAKLICAVLAVMAVLALSANAETAATPPTAPADCSDVVYDMIDCLTYVTEGSNETKPDSSCCSGVGAVVKTSPTCLCAALNLAATLNVTVNMTRALALPHYCSVPMPSIDHCDVEGPPGAAPVPTPPPKSSPAPSPVPVAPSPAPVSPSPAPVSPSPLIPEVPSPSPSPSSSLDQSSAKRASASFFLLLAGLAVATKVLIL